MYAKKPVPAKITRQAQAMRTSVASKPKLSANAPHTPAIFLFFFESLRGFILLFLFRMFQFSLKYFLKGMQLHPALGLLFLQARIAPFLLAKL